jgi:hypothetical protein
MSHQADRQEVEHEEDGPKVIEVEPAEAGLEALGAALEELLEHGCAGVTPGEGADGERLRFPPGLGRRLAVPVCTRTCVYMGKGG